jgi:hypothetical protein
MTQQRWPEPAVALVRKLWPDHSAWAIAALLKAECGFVVTRNAVIGKAHRMGLEKAGQNVSDGWRRAL